MKITIAIMALLSAAPLAAAAGAETAALKGKDAYLGQTPPGTAPETFAPGIVSTKEAIEFAGTFSPDGREYYWTRRSAGEYNKLQYTEYKDGKWTTER